MNLSLSELVRMIVTFALLALLLTWCSRGLAYETDSPELRVERCESLLNDCDSIIAQQAELYLKLKQHDSELQKALNNSAKKLKEYENPEWYKRTDILILTAFFSGVFVTLSLQK